MKLRTKLLLGVGLLLLVMAILMYVLPIRFVRQDIYVAADQIHELLIAEHQQLLRSQQKWIADEYKRAKLNTNALLLMIYEDPHVNSKLHFNEQGDRAVWQALVRIASLSQQVGFVQLHDIHAGKVAVITPQAVALYPIGSVTKKHGLIRLTLVHEGGEKPFLAVPLPQGEQNLSDFTFYALLDIEKVKMQMPKLREEISALTPSFIEKELSTALTSTAESEPALQWAVKAELMRILTPFYVEGITLEKNAFLPEGIARVDATGNGHAILAKEAYSSIPLFDDRMYYKEHLADRPSQPLADGSAIVVQKERGIAYTANTLLLDTSFLTVGTAVDFLAQELALASNRMIFLKADSHLWIGYDGDGKPVAHDTIEKIISSGAFEEKTGIINIEGRTLFFGRVGSLENDRLVFYDFHPFGGERSILSTLLALEEKLTGRIANQLFLITLIVILAVLIFIARMMFLIINPILKLALATESVVAGKYGEVRLPQMGTRKDEVAVLTHAFEEMVEGLQEREKIRGVLDKVVSKEVADEILKSQVHLGGEDRPVTMLFGDIRGFTSLSSGLTPQKTIELLNECMTKVSRVVEGEGGIIDKYVGDEVMAIYGAPIFHSDHALRAVSSGLLIIENLKQWNRARVLHGEPSIEMGIGIHTGVVVAGNMGAEDRLNYTVLGTNVNLASRLCSVAKPCQLLISGDILKQPGIKDSFYIKALSPIHFKGFSQPVEVYEVSDFKWVTGS